MATQTMSTRSATFKISWITLQAMTVLWMFGHIMLMFFESVRATLFLGWAAFELLSAIVLYIPFRRGEKWAWYTIWILVILFASTILFNAQIAPFYVGAAVVMAVCLLLARPAFFQKGSST